MTDFERKCHNIALSCARARYDKKNDIVTVQMRVPRSERDAWRKAALSRGLSFTSFVRQLIERAAKDE